jgi:hypothetical protein
MIPFIPLLRPPRKHRNRAKPQLPTAPPVPPAANVLSVRSVGPGASDAVWSFDVDIVDIKGAAGGVMGLTIQGVTPTGDYELLGGGEVGVGYDGVVPVGNMWVANPAACAITFAGGALLTFGDGEVE